MEWNDMVKKKTMVGLRFFFFKQGTPWIGFHLAQNVAKLGYTASEITSFWCCIDCMHPGK